MKRILYFGYFIKNTNYSKLIKSFKEVKEKEKLSYAKIFKDIIISAFRYKSSFHDYFLFEFYKKDHEERNSYLTTGGLYEFYTTFNDKNNIYNFRNKAIFNKKFGKFIKRDFIFLNDCTRDEFIKWVKNKNCIVAKPNEGVAGRGIEKIYIRDWISVESLYDYLKKKKLDLIEDCIQQHPKMDKLNPSSVNTIRIITVTWQGVTDIVAAVLRIGVGNHVDNFSAGGIAAPIDIATGEIYQSAVSKTGSLTYEIHPITHEKIKGFTIPYWDEVINIVEETSKIIPEVRTVGWDIAITKDGPELVEGNDNWNKDSFQLPYREGRRYILNKYTVK